MLSGDINPDKSSCTAKTVRVNKNGSIDIDLGPEQAFAIHHNAKLENFDEEADWKHTVIFVKAQTKLGQELFLRGGIDHDYALNELNFTCTDSNYFCAIPIRHKNLKSNSLRKNDTYLDWYGRQVGQDLQAEGSPMVWTTDYWDSDAWGEEEKLVKEHGYGVDPFNMWGPHYWMLDIDVDCSKTIGGWFEVRAFMKNGSEWEQDIEHEPVPLDGTFKGGGKNHLVECGKVNVFEFNQNESENLPLNYARRTSSHFERFDHFDTNGDGQLELGEFLRPLKSMTRKSMRNKDRDKNGILTFEEFYKRNIRRRDMTKHIHKINECVINMDNSFDLNPDSYLSPKTMFANADTNGASGLDLAEMLEMAKNTRTSDFNKRDLNNDDRLSRKEYAEGEEFFQSKNRAKRICIRRVVRG